MFIGGCGGSTSGGLKVTRIILLFKSMTAVLRQKLHPRAVIQTRAGGENFSESMLLEVFCFFFIYTMSIFLWTALIAASGADIPSALGLSIATMSNSGPALGQFGATCNWSAMPAMTKWSSPCPCLWAGLNLLRFSSFSSPLSGEKTDGKTKRIFLQTKVCQEISVFSCKENVPGVMGIRDDFLVYFQQMSGNIC